MAKETQGAAIDSARAQGGIFQAAWPVRRRGLLALLGLAMLLPGPWALAQSSTFASLYSFDYTHGAGPAAGLAEGSDGNFYGVTVNGGAYGFGTAFVVTPQGSLSVLHDFGNGSDGANPGGALIQGSDGLFYGTTESGGDFSSGSVFSMTAGGAVTVLHSFGGTDGDFPLFALVQASDGSFYGTTVAGGTVDGGTAFKITSSGAFTSLLSFDGTNGMTPYGPLVQGRDGALYGVTTEQNIIGGSQGTIFRLTTKGAVTTLHTFSGADGQWPEGSLVLGRDGALYGATGQGGVNNDGTIFKLTTDGTLTTLASFDGSNGRDPVAGLIEGSDGVLYGTTDLGGSRGAGTIFSVTTSGELGSLYSLGGADGQFPSSGLTLGSDGYFYGTAFSGGADPNAPYGTIFKLTALAAKPSFSPASGIYLLSQSVTITDAAPGATIYYTTDGSTPTTDSAVYTGPILIGKTPSGQPATLKAIALAPGYPLSAVSSAKFVVLTAH